MNSNLNYQLIIQKLIETIIRMRVNLKSSQVNKILSFSQFVREGYHYDFNLTDFLGNLYDNQIYNIKKLASNSKEKKLSIKINFFLQAKNSKQVKQLQFWQLQLQKQSISTLSTLQDSIQDQKKSRKQILKLFQTIISNLIKLPIWQHYLKDNRLRKVVRKQYILNYKICKYQLIFPTNNYDSKIQIINSFPDAQIKMKILFKKDISLILNKMLTEKKTAQQLKSQIIQSDKILKKISEFCFYDETLDIIFIASENQLNPQNQIVSYQQQKSNEDQFILIEEIFTQQQKRFNQFQKELKNIQSKFQRFQQQEYMK